MNNKHNKRTNDTKTVYSFLIGGICGALSALLGAAGISTMVLSGTIEQSVMVYFSVAVVFLAGLIGTGIATKLVSKKRLLVCAATAGVLGFLFSSINIICFNGDFSGLGINMLSLLLAAAISCMASRYFGGGKRRYRTYSR